MCCSQSVFVCCVCIRLSCDCILCSVVFVDGTLRSLPVLQLEEPSLGCNICVPVYVCTAGDSCEVPQLAEGATSVLCRPDGAGLLSPTHQ